jgi:hypothetical protein
MIERRFHLFSMLDFAARKHRISVTIIKKALATHRVTKAFNGGRGKD